VKRFLIPTLLALLAVSGVIYAVTITDLHPCRIFDPPGTLYEVAWECPVCHTQMVYQVPPDWDWRLAGRVRDNCESCGLILRGEVRRVDR
jgi:hypothetical protein